MGKVTAVCVVSVDFSEAFDTVSCSTFIATSGTYGLISGWKIGWTSRSGGEQCKVHLAAGYPSEVNTGSTLFNDFNDSLDDGMEHALSKLVKGFKLGENG